MAYNNYYPQYYQPNTIQNGGLVYVQSEKEALEYLIANGTSVTFIDPQNMKLYIKTKGFSALDQPVFKKYNLVETSDENAETTPVDYVSKEDLESIISDIKYLKKQLKKEGNK